jgi:hypothetical protein
LALSLASFVALLSFLFLLLVLNLLSLALHSSFSLFHLGLLFLCGRFIMIFLLASFPQALPVFFSRVQLVPLTDFLFVFLH